MTKKNKSLEGKETVEVFKDLDKGALKTEAFIEKNAKKIMLGFGVFLVAILGYFGYQHLVVGPKNDEATIAYLDAQKNLSQGKDDLALGGKSAANPGFKGTYEQFSGTKIGKLAAYNAGVIEYKKGNYQKAYDLLDKFSSDSKILVALKHGIMGDCKANLNKNDEALAMYEKAISSSDDPFTSYFFTRKAGIVSLALKKKAEAKKYFSTIEEKYLEYDGGMSDSYIEMVKYY